jgi:hypothetical protein
MDLNFYHPAHLRHRKLAELKALTIDEIKKISESYPIMNGDLLIAKKGDKKPIVSSATWKSLYSLLRNNHQFEIVGTRFGEPKETIEQIIKTSAPLSEPEFVAPAHPIFSQPAIQSEQKRRGRPKRIEQINN